MGYSKHLKQFFEICFRKYELFDRLIDVKRIVVSLRHNNMGNAKSY